MQGIGECTGRLRIDAQVFGTHVEQVFRPRRTIGNAAAEGLGHADQSDADLRVGRLRQRTNQRGTAKAGTDDGDMGFHVQLPLNDPHVVPVARRERVNKWLAASKRKRMS